MLGSEDSHFHSRIDEEFVRNPTLCVTVYCSDPSFPACLWPQVPAFKSLAFKRFRDGRIRH